MSDKPAKLAISKFYEAIQLCADESEISLFCQMSLTLSAKTIHGIEGKKFKKEFLRGASDDNEMIKPQQSVQH